MSFVSIQRNKTTEGVLLQDSSSSVCNVKEVFFENDTREVGCVHSDVHVKEEDLDNFISMDDDDCFLSYLDNEKTSVAHIQGKELSCIKCYFCNICGHIADNFAFHKDFCHAYQNSKVPSKIDFGDELMENESLRSSVSSLAESLRGGNDALTGELSLPLDCFCWCLVLHLS